MMNKRLSKLGATFKKYNCDAILITDLMNVRYLTGFTGSNGTVLAFNPDRHKHKPILYTDGRYTLQSKEETSGFEIVITVTTLEEITARLNSFDMQKIVFEANNLTYDKYQKISDHFKGDVHPIDDNIKDIRFLKDETEVEETRTSINIATKSFNQILPLFKKGITEEEIRTELEYACQKNGAKKQSFDSIVAFGPNSALPHAQPGKAKLEEESLIIVDYGVYNSTYASDETITLYYGNNPSDTVKTIYSLVKDAHDKAIEVVKPGMTAKELDAVAREVISNGGYGDQFVHSLGHSVGLETHDGFVLSHKSSHIIEEGMILTIEPGIYIEGLGGVRLEDMILITSTGAEMLTSLPKSLSENTISI